MAILTRLGAKKTTRVVAISPPMKALIAQVARALAAWPLLAMRWPSNVDAMADEWPSVEQDSGVQSPKSPPKQTSANMMNAAVASSEKLRQQQRHRHGGAKPREDADGGAQEGTDQHPEEIDGCQGAGEAAHEGPSWSIRGSLLRGRRAG